MKKFVSVILIAITAVLILASCKTEPTAPTYADNIVADTVMASAGKSVASFDTLSKTDDMYFEYMVKAKKADVDSYEIKLQPNGTTLDEVGILKARTDTVDSVKQSITTYLADRNAAWTGLYLTEEYPKLKNAEVRVYGNYVVYAILSDSEKTAFFQAAEKAVTAK